MTFERLPIQIHVPKTAGTSIRVALGISELSPAQPPHATAADLRAALGDEAWSRGFSFTIARNPFERIVSHYSYGLRHRNPGTRKRFLEDHPTFAHYVKAVCSGAEGPLTVCEYVGDEVLDYYGRFERLESAWATIRGEIGWHGEGELGRLNESGHDEYRGYYSEETRRLVRSRFADDLERFGYCF